MKVVVLLTCVVASQGACDGDDQAAINKFPAGSADGSFPKVVSDCSRSALGWSGIDETSFNSCLVSKTGAKQACTDCFYAGAKYGFANCKWDCLTSWCSSKCLTCAQPSTAGVVACAGFTAPQPSNCDASHEVVREEFVKFVNKYGREYHGEEYARKFEIFARNYAYVQQENSRNLPYRLAINEFSDIAPEEFAKTHFGMIAPSPERMWGVPYLGRHKWNGEKLADAVDWTTKGAVTPVKNQGQCGSCWSFSSTGALEGAFKIAGGGLVAMSEQQLVDCCKIGGCAGCNGGLMDYAFQYLHNHHICTEASYGYTGRDGSCHDSSCSAAVATGGVTGYQDVAHDDTNALMSAAAQQPVSIAIEADQQSFQGYSGGVLTKECGTRLDHGVLLVGYGTDGGTDYWKVKNSWGGSWGESGYIRLERGLSGGGQCGLKGQPSYPHVANKPGPPGPSPSPSPSSNCGSLKLEYCCNLGTPCDCSKASSENGQCQWFSYDYCCKTGTPCTCGASDGITV